MIAGNELDWLVPVVVAVITVAGPVIGWYLRFVLKELRDLKERKVDRDVVIELRNDFRQEFSELHKELSDRDRKFTNIITQLAVLSEKMTRVEDLMITRTTCPLMVGTKNTTKLGDRDNG